MKNCLVCRLSTKEQLKFSEVSKLLIINMKEELFKTAVLIIHWVLQLRINLYLHEGQQSEWMWSPKDFSYASVIKVIESLIRTQGVPNGLCNVVFSIMQNS